MSQQDGPPTLIGDEWQRRTNAPDIPEPESNSSDPNDGSASAPSEFYEHAQPIPIEADPTVSATEDVDVSQAAAESEPVPEEPEIDHLSRIDAELASLRAETVHVNAVLDRLHADNERLRRGESAQLLLPLFRDLVKLSDDWTIMAASWDEKDAATPTDVARKCRDIAEDAALILQRHGVDVFAPDIGSTFERRQHRLVGTTKAESQEADNTIAEVRKAGFVYGDKVIRFAEVVVARA